MKHIGIVGVTAEGAALCLTTICAEAGKRLEKFDHPEITLHELSFKPHIELSKKGDWEGVAELILASIKKLEGAGADFAIMPANTSHYAFPYVQAKTPIPMLSILEIVADECKSKGYSKVAVLGTKFTMEGGLYNAVLQSSGIESIIPNEVDRNRIGGVILDEIVPQNMNENTVPDTLEIIKHLKEMGAEAVILGCTELPLIVGDHNSALPTIDSTRLLDLKALDYALK